MSDLDKIAERLTEQRIATETAEKDRLRAEQERRRLEAWSRSRESQVVELVNEVVDELNHQAPKPVLLKVEHSGAAVAYKAGEKSLAIGFYEPSLVTGPGEKTSTLRREGAVHSGYIRVRAGGKNHRGWNLVLRSDAEDGEWSLVDFKPFDAGHKSTAASAPDLVAALTAHWDHVTMLDQVEVTPWGRDKVVQILSVLAG